MRNRATAPTIRRAEDRGRTDLGWLDSRHTFSFGQYHDPDHIGFRSLRVINDDRVAPGQGFGEHGHRDMEILTWVLEGELAHKDSLGNGGVIRPGQLQAMSAGTGIRHSEFNGSNDQSVHFLQIWLLPDQRGVEPRYEQTSFDREEFRRAFRLVASRDGRDGSASIHQDADLYIATPDAGRKITFTLRPDRHGWLHVARGRISLHGHTLGEGDGAAIEPGSTLDLNAEEDSEILLFDLA